MANLDDKKELTYKKNNVGIIGYWFASNYGGVASYYSLYKTIEKMGYTPFLVDNPYFETDKEGYDVFSRNFFKNQEMVVAPAFNNENLAKLNDFTDIFLLGSDQVLTTNSLKGFGKLFLMDFALNNKRRIAYSASCGGDNLNFDNGLLNVAKNNLKKFDYVSVREYSAVDLLRNKLGIESQVMIDPIFFTQAEEYIKLSKQSNLKEEGGYLFAYILDPTNDKKKCIEKVASELSLKIKVGLDGRKFTHNGNFEKMDMKENTLPELNEFEWLYYLCNSSYIITDSFHGSVMAIILNKPFIMIANHGRGLPRFLTLSKIFNLGERLIESSKDLNEKLIKSEIDFNIVNEIIKNETQKSFVWLKQALTERRINNSIYKTLDIVNLCTGCSVCANICPTKAITMCEDKDGFLKPVIDREKCINCGLCSNKCVALHQTYNNNENPKCYAVMANDKIREVSSSGGVFSVVADWILSKKGYVCGAVFTKDFHVEHVLISKSKDLDKMRGSKYYQSDLKDNYAKIKKLLDEDKYVLFTGMPCHVAGLYSYLGKKYDNLFTIDILCHGITSRKVFEKYRKDVLGNKKLVDLKFKAKKPWGWHAGVNATFSDGSKYSKIIEEDLFYVAYIQGLSKNNSCGTCKFNRLPRQGDITIGDFWRVQDFDKALNDNKGTSVVLINNEHGEFLFKSVENKFTVSREVPISYAKAGNGIISYPYKLHDKRDEFFEKLDSTDFGELVNMYRKKADAVNLSSTPEYLKEFYYLAEIVAKNKGKRKVVLWGDSWQVKGALSKYFGISTEFVITIYPQNANGGTVKYFDEIKGKSSEYYIVICGKVYDENDVKKLNSFGYKETKDFVYRQIKPIVLENYDLSKPYKDMYGNTILGGNGVAKKITLRGYNNHIIIQNNVWNMKNLVIDLTANSNIYIEQGCNFTQPDTKIETKGYDGTASVKIKQGCIFMDTLFRLYVHQQGVSILINEKCTFGEKVSLRANQAKHIIIGRDSMFSSEIELWAGDGHSIIDIRQNQSINLFPKDTSNQKNYIVLGEHTWVGYRSFILAGTNIGEGSVIGAQSVVKGVFPNNCSIAGSPAKLIRSDIAWSREMCANDLSRCNEYTKLTSNSKPAIVGKNVLVVGGTKFMGVQLVKNLIASGNQVTIATRGKTKDSFGDEVKRIIVDISNYEQCKKAFSGKQFDVVFHNLAYCSNYVKNLLNFVKCDKYIQLSSIAVYGKNLNMFIDENLFDPQKITLQWLNQGKDYGYEKAQAECAVVQQYKDIPSVIVRIPYVTKTERLYYYCDSIVNQKPMKIDDINIRFTFIQDTEVGSFLPWLAGQNYSGIVNFSSEGSVSIKEIIEYIESKTGYKALIDKDNGIESPFNDSFNFNLNKLKTINYIPSKLNDWFWSLLDEYIKRGIVLKKK